MTSLTSRTARAAAPLAVAAIALGVVVAAPAVPSASAAPFACTADFFWVQDAQLIRGSPLNTPFGAQVGVPNPTGRYNALGFNTEDGYLYGIGWDGAIDDQLVRIDDTGAVTPLGIPAGLPSGPTVFYNAGTFDDAGNLWVSPSSDFDLYQVDVSANVLVSVVAPDLEPATALNIGADLVWREGGIIRMLGGNPGRLHYTDLATGVATVTTSTAGITGVVGARPAMWLTGDDRLFTVNGTNAVAEIVNWQTTGFTLQSMGTGSLGTNGDGASCLDAASPFGLAATDDDYTGTPLPAADGGAVGSIWGNDTRNSAVLDPTSVTTTVTADGGLTGTTIGADGAVTVLPGFAPGSYALDYEICSIAVPAECAQARIFILLTAPLPASVPAGPTLPPTGTEAAPIVALIGALVLAVGAALRLRSRRPIVE